MGRKTKYTPEVVKELVKIIAGGHTHRTACGYMGISHDTFYRWMNKYPEFSDTIKKAENQAKIGLLEKIKKAGDEHWQAAAWVLERRWPEDFAQAPTKVDLRLFEDFQNDVLDAIGEQPSNVRDAILTTVAEKQSLRSVSKEG